MSRYGERLQLKIIYNIREAGEISLLDLYKKIFGTGEFVRHTLVHNFICSVFELYQENFISIYKKNIKNDVERHFNMGDDIGLRDNAYVLNSLMSSIFQCQNDGHNSREDVSILNPKNVFVSMTEKLNKAQRIIGFSVSDEIKQLQMELNRYSILGEVNHRLRSDVFVIMPFLEQLKPIYEDHIKVVCDEMGYSCQRVDKINRASIITNDIWSLINNANIVICDCTGKNPNVFYELGLAHAIGKNVICITQNSEEIPFDIQQIRYIKYESTSNGLSELREKLKMYIETDRETK